MKLYIIFIIFSFNALANNYLMRFYFANEEASKAILQITQDATLKLGIPSAFVFVKEEELVTKATLYSALNIVITNNYDVILSLQKLGYLHKVLMKDNLVTIFFAEKNLNKPLFITNSNLEESIKDAFGNNIDKIIFTKEECNNIKLLLNQNKDYGYIILKESIAKKCNINIFSLYKKDYNTYYIAINEGHYNSRRIWNFFESYSVKTIIQNNFYIK